MIASEGFDHASISDLGISFWVCPHRAFTTLSSILQRDRLHQLFHRFSELRKRIYDVIQYTGLKSNIWGTLDGVKSYRNFVEGWKKDS